jgi:hypothetical protein
MDDLQIQEEPQNLDDEQPVFDDLIQNSPDMPFPNPNGPLSLPPAPPVPKPNVFPVVASKKIRSTSFFVPKPYHSEQIFMGNSRTAIAPSISVSFASIKRRLDKEYLEFSKFQLDALQGPNFRDILTREAHVSIGLIMVSVKHAPQRGLFSNNQI